MAASLPIGWGWFLQSGSSRRRANDLGVTSALISRSRHGLQAIQRVVPVGPGELLLTRSRNASDVAIVSSRSKTGAIVLYVARRQSVAASAEQGAGGIHADPAGLQTIVVYGGFCKVVCQSHLPQHSGGVIPDRRIRRGQSCRVLGIGPTASHLRNTTGAVESVLQRNSAIGRDRRCNACEVVDIGHPHAPARTSVHRCARQAVN